MTAYRVLVLVACWWPASATALEQQYQDLSVSVEVAPVFGLTIDQPHVAFGFIEPATTKILGEGAYAQEVRCRSNAGRAWHIKAHVHSLRNLEARTNLPPSSLKWRVAGSTGEVSTSELPTDFTPFADEPVLIYRSRGDDERGREVVLRMQYSLTTPSAVRAGTYVGQIVFTLVESP